MVEVKDTKFIVTGGTPLRGNIRVSGMKNAALPILFGCMLNKNTCVINNMPRVTDIDLALQILEAAGTSIRWINHSSVEICTKDAQPMMAPPDLVRRMRGSSYVLGAELGRFGHTKISQLGGCAFAARPIDQHKKAFSCLGAIVMDGEQFVFADAESGNRLRGGNIVFDIQSVGATVNAILAATLADGITTIENAAREPHIVDLANFLNACGADIRGAGTTMIKIRGVEELHGCNYTIAPDMIEAGTYLAMAAGTGGDVVVQDIIPQHLKSVCSKLSEMGVRLEDLGDAIHITSDGLLDPVKITAAPYPSFPTDLQPQFTTLLSISLGESIVTDEVFPTRFQYAEALNKMGAEVSVDLEKGRAVINGVKYLSGAKVQATDLRAAAALLTAGLMAKGESEITGISFLKRGYENIVEKLSGIGADLREES